jgi:hypothetical protein
MTTLTDTQVVTASGGLVELGYTALTTSPTVGSVWTSIASTTVVADGSKLLVEFQSPYVSGASNARLAISGTNYRFGDLAAAGPFRQSFVITPSAGSVTVAVEFFSAGGATINGSGGTYGAGSAFLRVSKIVSATQWPAVTTGTIICTSTTRPASPFEGQTIYETDTDLSLTYTGAAWVQTGNSTGAWTAFTPTITQSGNVTFSGPMRYTRIGRTVHANCALSVSGSGTAGNIVTVSLPITANAALPVVGAAWIYDASTGTRYICTADLQSTTTVAFQHDTSGSSAWGAAPSIGLASTDQIRFGITYEAAS